MTSKVYPSAADAVADITSGSTLAVGGFGLCGIPDALIEALAESGATDLEVFSNNCGVDGQGLGVLLGLGRIRRVTASYVGENKEFARQYLAGELEVELTPQGTLAERMRAGGAGIPAFFTPAGVGSPVSDGGLPWRYAADGSVAVASPPKETRVFGDKRYVMEESITADYALVHAQLRRYRRQPRLQQDGDEFQPTGRDGGADHHRAGRATRRAGRHRSRLGAPAGCLRSAHRAHRTAGEADREADRPPGSRSDRNEREPVEVRRGLDP